MGKKEASTACANRKYDFYNGQPQISKIVSQNPGNH